MIYELHAPPGMAPFPDVFAGFPPRILGLAIWMVFSLLALAYAFAVKDSQPRRLLGIPIPMLFAAAIFTGLFINTYDLVDEVSINLKHSYNLYHYGKFSMSPQRWIEGTVESVYYLLHVPFAWSQRSLIVANYVISLLVGLLHLPLAGYALDPKASARKSTLQLCGFALSLPLMTTFSSGFGNGLVSLVFLAAIGSALNSRERRSLVISGLLPLLRPDAIALSAINAAVIAVSRRVAGKRFLSLREHGLPLLVPIVSAGLYYSFYRAAFGNWVPTPIFFKTVHLGMIAMTDKAGVVKDVLVFFSQGARALALICILLFFADFLMRGQVARRFAADQRVFSLGMYALATFPLFLFYSVAFRTLGDYSFGTYPRYWIAFDLTLRLLVLALLAKVQLNWGRDETEKMPVVWRQDAALIVFLCLSMAFIAATITRESLLRKPGRSDSVFAGEFSERYLPANFSISTTEMDTFGLMMERPMIDLWGYTTPAIAFSKVCNAERVRFNDQYFLQVKPDVYWPYWFTNGLIPKGGTGNFDNAEESLAGFPHTSKLGNQLGDMSQVLAEYDVVFVRTQWNDLGYLVRKPSSEALVNSLIRRGFSVSRQRPVDMARFHKVYDGEARLIYNCR